MFHILVNILLIDIANYFIEILHFKKGLPHCGMDLLSTQAKVLEISSVLTI